MNGGDDGVETECILPLFIMQTKETCREQELGGYLLVEDFKRSSFSFSTPNDETKENKEMQVASTLHVYCVRILKICINCNQN